MLYEIVGYYITPRSPAERTVVAVCFDRAAAESVVALGVAGELEIEPVALIDRHGFPFLPKDILNVWPAFESSP